MAVKTVSWCFNVTDLKKNLDDLLIIMEDEIAEKRPLSNKFISADTQFKTLLYTRANVLVSLQEEYGERYEEIVAKIDLKQIPDKNARKKEYAR